MPSSNRSAIVIRRFQVMRRVICNEAKASTVEVVQRAGYIGVKNSPFSMIHCCDLWRRVGSLCIP